MRCSVFFISFLLTCIFAITFAAEREDFKCVEGVNYQENDCNHCFCAHGGLACTQMACISLNNEPRAKCDVGTTWAKDCNKCWCTESSGTICTVDKC